MTEPELPTLANERYALSKKLGEGGQAATFEAVDKRFGHLVVLKRFRVRGASSWKEVELAEREAKVLAALDHPNLPRYVEHFEEAGELWLVTRKIEGESLLERKKRGGAFSIPEVVRFLDDARAALDYLHARSPPVIHRDIKPSNVIVRPDRSYSLIDFGSVRDRLKPDGGSTVVGTFGYMAPEQFQGRAMPGSDVYAVGVTALVMLTGIDPEDLPHRGLAIDVAAALKGSVVPKKLARALEQMLEPDPDKRAKRVPLVDGARPDAGDGRRDRTRPRESPNLLDAWERERKGRRAREGDRGSSPWDELREGGKVLRDELAREGGRLLRDAGQKLREEVEREQARAGGRRSRDEKTRDRAERREARREEKRARRRDRADARHGRPDALVYVDWWNRVRRERESVPRILLGPVLLAFTIAQVAVGLALNVVVPLVLLLLSIVFGRGLRKAAAAVNKAGRRGRRYLGLVKRVMLHRDAEEHGGVGIGFRIATPEPPKVRVAASEAEPKSDADAELEAEATREAEEAAHGRRRGA